MGPFAGQNWGAGKPGRVAQGLRFASLSAFAWAVLAWGVLLLWGGSIAALFTESQAATGYMTRYLATNSTFNAINEPLKASALVIWRMVILSLPLAWVGLAM